MKKLLISLTLMMMVLPTAAWSISVMVSTTNNNFEAGFQGSGIANGWEAMPGTSGTYAGDNTPANVHSGTWSQKVVTTTATGVKAKFDTLPGLCKVSVWVKAPVGVAKFAIMTYQEVLLDPEPVLAPSDYMTNTSSGWQKLTKTVVAKRVDTYIPASGTIVSTDTIVVVCATYGGTAYFDEVTVEPVGEHTQPHEMWYTDGGGSPFLVGGVFDGNVILGRILGSPVMYWDCVPWLPPYQPLLYQTPTPGATIALNPEQTSKCATIIKSDGHDYIYCTTGYGDIQQSVDWGALGPIIKFNNAPALRSKSNKDASAIVTDGTYLYCQDDNLGANAAINKIYKFAVTHAGGGSIANAGGGFPVTITGYSQFLGAKIETGNPFNFAPTWSPDGKWILLVSGEHYNCHPHVVRRDGIGLRKLADRGGYEGVTLFLDVPDYHEGSSDTPAWSQDSKWIYYTAKVGEAVELMRVSLDGKLEQLSHSAPGVRHYHPKPSWDGHWLLFGATRDSVRQLYISKSDGTQARPITQLKSGYAAMWGYWQPTN